MFVKPKRRSHCRGFQVIGLQYAGIQCCLQTRKRQSLQHITNNPASDAQCLSSYRPASKALSHCCWLFPLPRFSSSSTKFESYIYMYMYVHALGQQTQFQASQLEFTSTDIRTLKATMISIPCGYQVAHSQNHCFPHHCLSLAWGCCHPLVIHTNLASDKQKSSNTVIVVPARLMNQIHPKPST